MTTIDDSSLSKPFISPLCLVCARANDLEAPASCEAFPEGIPQEILSGEFVHTKKFRKEEFIFKPLKRGGKHELQTRTVDG